MKSFVRRLLRRPRVRRNVLVEPFADLKRCQFVGSVRVGFRSYANDSLFRNVVVGRFCSIGRRCSIGAARHAVDALTTHPAGAPSGFDGDPPTHIGHDVWIGDNAIVVAGVRIGDGAVIGAGAVVTRDVASYAIVVGVPARLLRPRFNAALVERLLAVRWWQFGDAALAMAADQSIDSALTHIARQPPPEFTESFAPFVEP